MESTPVGPLTIELAEVLWGWPHTVGMFRGRVSHWKHLTGDICNEERFQWAVRLLSHFSGHIMWSDPFIEDDWESLISEIRGFYQKEFEAEKQKLIEKRESLVIATFAEAHAERTKALMLLEAAEDPSEYAAAHPSIYTVRPDAGIAGVLFGAVSDIEINIHPKEVPPCGDPWISPHCDWLLENLTPFMLDAIHVHVQEAAMSVLRCELVSWTEHPQSSTDVPRAVNRCFMALAKRLGDHISELLRQTEADAP